MGIPPLSKLSILIIPESATQIKSKAGIFVPNIAFIYPSGCVPYCTMPKLATGDFSPVLVFGFEHCCPGYDHMNGEFPVLKPGANAISWTGTVTKVVVRPN